jgi:predicted nucleic acid-binding protein
VLNPADQLHLKATEVSKGLGKVIKAHRTDGTAVLSTQVLQEYVNVALRKLQLPVPLVRERLSLYARFDLVPTTPEIGPWPCTR